MKIVLVGASSGIGRQLAETLEHQGHQVFGLSRTTGCDVTDWDQVTRAVQDVRQRWTTIDALICCAGIHGDLGSAMESDPHAWMQGTQNNFASMFFPIRAFYSLLTVRASSHKKVICFSGGGATGSRPMFSSYAVAKTGIVRFVEILADEWKDQGIDINAIAPGAISTRLTDEVIALGAGRVGESEYAQALKVKNGQGGSIEKVAGLVQFLLSGDSDNITGRLFAAQWDPWHDKTHLRRALEVRDFGKLRRIAE